MSNVGWSAHSTRQPPSPLGAVPPAGWPAAGIAADRVSPSSQPVILRRAAVVSFLQPSFDGDS